MTREMICPMCGAHVAVESSSSGSNGTIETIVPATATTDDPASPFDSTAPDLHMTGPAITAGIDLFASGEVPAVAEPGLDPDAEAFGSLGSDPELSIPVPPVIDELQPEIGAPPGSDAAGFEPVPDGEPPVSSGEAAVAGLGLELGGPISSAMSTPPPSAQAETANADDAEDTGEEAHAGLSIGRILLLSYASALTVACLWMAWQLRHVAGRPTTPDRFEAAFGGDDHPDGLRGGESRTVARPSALPPGRVTTLGHSLRIGALEFTPLSIAATAVEQEHGGLDGQRKSRPGPEGALVLRARFRNVSENGVFTPLDEAFVREPAEGLPASLIVTDGGARIYPARLPIESEWSIVGQEFRALKPGESYETIIVSDGDARGRIDGPAVWRLRLRTDATGEEGSTTVVGVQFSPDEIR